METVNYIVRSIDNNGKEGFYSGRAGPGWITFNRDEAFRYQTKERAQGKATDFNRMSEIHGLRFIAHLD